MKNRILALKEYQKQFKNKSLASSEGVKSLFEIARIERNENVWSNVLAFFMDVKNGSGLELAFLQALKKAIELAHPKMEDPAQLENLLIGVERIEVYREVYSGLDNRLDLIIKLPDFVLGIENKVYHKLKNDLNDYDNLLEEKADGRVKQLIVLSFAEIPQKDHWQKFPIVYYSSFFRKLEDELKVEKFENNPYKKIVTEFMDLGNKLTNTIKVEMERQKFFNDNKANLKPLIEDYNQINKTCGSDINELKKVLRTMSDYNEIEFIIWENTTMYFQLNGENKLSIDTYLDPFGWEIHVYQQQKITFDSDVKSFISALESSLGNENFEILMKPGDLRAVWEFKYETPLDKIKEYLMKIIQESKSAF